MHGLNDNMEIFISHFSFAYLCISINIESENDTIYSVSNLVNTWSKPGLSQVTRDLNSPK